MIQHFPSKDGLFTIVIKTQNRKIYCCEAESISKASFQWMKQYNTRFTLYDKENGLMQLT